MLEAPATEVVPAGHAVHWSAAVRLGESPYVPDRQSKAQPAKLTVKLPVVCIHLPSGQVQVNASIDSTIVVDVLWLTKVTSSRETDGDAE